MNTIGRFLLAVLLALLAGTAVAEEGGRSLASWNRQVVHSKAIGLEIFQKGQGVPVLMHPSLGRPAQDFEQLGNALAAAGYRAILVNPRGIGASTGPMEGVTLEDLGADLWAVADALQIDRVVLLGHALGNRVVRAAATQRNPRVMGLILLAAGGEVAMAPDTMAEFTRAFDPGLPQEARQQAMAAAFFAPGNDATVWKDGWHLATAGLQVAATRRTNMEPLYAGGTAPALVVQGLDDKIALPINGWNFATRRPNVRLVALPRMGHAILSEQPEAVAAAVLDFLRSVR